MKFNNGDKVVIEIKGVLPNEYGDPVYIAGDDYFGEVIPLEKSAEPLLAYTEPLNDKIKRQEEEIIRLLKENAELKRDLKYYHTGTDTCDIESTRAAGQQEAWELAQKIFNNEDLGGYSIHELNEIFDTSVIREIINLTYSEAAAKVEVCEKKKKVLELQMSPLYARDVLQSMVEQNCNGNESDALVIAINALTDKIGDGVE